MESRERNMIENTENNVVNMGNTIDALHRDVKQLKRDLDIAINNQTEIYNLLQRIANKR